LPAMGGSQGRKRMHIQHLDGDRCIESWTLICDSSETAMRSSDRVMAMNGGGYRQDIGVCQEIMDLDTLQKWVRMDGPLGWQAQS
jgi:hypothetical protein